MRGANKQQTWFFTKTKSSALLARVCCVLVIFNFVVWRWGGDRCGPSSLSYLSSLIPILTLPKLGLCPKQFSFQTPRVPSYFMSVFWLWQTLRLYWWLNNHYLISRLNSSLFMFNLHVLRCVPGSKIFVININLCFGSTRFFILCPILVISIGRSPSCILTTSSPLFSIRMRILDIFQYSRLSTPALILISGLRKIFSWHAYYDLFLLQKHWEHSVQTLQTDILWRLGFQI